MALKVKAKAICSCVSKILTLGNEKKKLFLLHFARLIVSLRLCLENTHARQ